MRYARFGIFLSALALFACGDSPSSPTGAAGNFRLMITDSPFSDAKAVLVTFSSVSAHRSGEGGFTTIGSGTRTCDLKKLQGPQDVLGVGTIPEGHYTQVRLVVTSATLHFDNPSSGDACATTISAPSGRSATIEVPSGEVRLNREFDVPASGAVTMVLDFDGDASIRETGNGRYRMTPVIGVVSVQ